MKTQQITLPNLVKKALMELISGHFTIRKLSETMLQMAPNEPHLTLRHACQISYRYTNRLVKLGALEKHTNNNNRNSYSASNRFYSFEYLESRFPLRVRLLARSSEEQDNISKLQETMHKKALEYFCIAFNHMGECDEYARLEREHPELKHLFSYEFAVSRAERAKFQGRFKAIELVLTKSMAEKPKSNS